MHVLYRECICGNRKYINFYLDMNFCTRDWDIYIQIPRVVVIFIILCNIEGQYYVSWFLQIAAWSHGFPVFLGLPAVLLSSPLKILERIWRGIHNNRTYVMRNDLNRFTEECLVCLHDGRKTDGIRNYIFQRSRSSIVAISPGWLCLVKYIYLFKKKTQHFFLLRMTWLKVGPSKSYHIILQDSVSNDTKYIAWFTPHILAWWELETDMLFRRGQFSWE